MFLLLLLWFRLFEGLSLSSDLAVKLEFKLMIGFEYWFVMLDSRVIVFCVFFVQLFVF